MKITNKLNLPSSLMNYAIKDSTEHTPKPNRYEVTELLLSVREILLKRAHYDNIEIDVSEITPAIFGTAVHSILEENTEADGNVYTEYPIEFDTGVTTISGRIDLLDLNQLLIGDYKTCSVSKVIHKDFEDWRKQGLTYAYLVYKKLGIITRHLKFYALLKDWSKLKSANQTDFPKSPIAIWTYDIQDSDYDYIEDFIINKINDISAALSTGIIPDCTDEEKWYTGTKYAVYKKAGDKKASKIFDSEEDAHQYITDECNGAGEIEVRKGEYLKCKLYCSCYKFCEKGGK